jgi:hypothetical protein
MAYDVRFEIPVRRLGKSDVTFLVKRGGGRLGTLEISKGAVVWYPRGAQRGYKANWVKFDKVIKQNVPRV